VDQRILKASLTELEELIWEQFRLGQVNTFTALTKVFEERVVRYGNYFATKRDSGNEPVDGVAGEGNSGSL